MSRNLLLLFALFAIVKTQNQTIVTVNNNANATEPDVSKTSQAIEANNVTTAAPTTTPVPSTTSKAPDTTTSAPVPSTPRPIPEPQQWNGTFGADNKTCIKLEFAVKISIHYNNTNKSDSLTGFTIPVDASVVQEDSHCSSNQTKSEAITIGFKNEENTSANLTVTFNRMDGNVFVEQLDLSFSLTQELFPQYINPKQYNSIVSAKKENLTLFKVASAHSYTCGSAQSASLDSTKDGIIGVKIDFLRSQVEAFSDSKDDKFDTPIDCKSTEISDVVPIAVGAALAGLVVIVLIAYFIGRRRSRRLAYQSV